MKQNTLIMMWFWRSLQGIAAFGQRATLAEAANWLSLASVMTQEELFTDTSQAAPPEPRSRSRLGVIVTGVLGGSLVALYAVAAPFVTPALRRVCLPFVPATSTQVENVLRVLRGRTGSLVDIGSGDGRIVSVPPLIGLYCIYALFSVGKTPVLWHNSCTKKKDSFFF